jgi:hypothetical protein
MLVAVTMPFARANARRWTFLVLAFGVVTVAGLVIWWAFERPFSNGERELVGTWRIRWDGSSSDLPLVYEFRPDRTCVIRNFDPGTGAITGEVTNLTWRRTDNTLVVRHSDAAVGPRWDVFGLRRSVCEVFTLTPDGPDRFRYAGEIEAGGAPGGQGVVSGTMTRSEPSP